MAKVRLLNGKPLMVSGKVALSDACCCGAAFTCSTSESVTVTFTGISIGCGCVSLTTIPSSVNVTDISMNGTFVLTGAAGFWDNSSCGFFAGIQYGVSLDCSGLPSVISGQGRAFVYCANAESQYEPDTPVGLVIGYEAGSVVFFASLVATGLAGRTNFLTMCGQHFTVGGDQYAVGINGTATIAF